MQPDMFQNHQSLLSSREYASTKRTKNDASMGKLYTSSEDLLFVVIARVQPGQAAHICLM
jgi:hypothetical protein